MSGPDLDNVQSLVLRGYRVLEAHPVQRYLYFRIDAAQGARAWLATMAKQVTSCRDFDRNAGPATVAVALTHAGLRRLPVPSDCPWPEAFVQGMAARADRLGDVGDSAPSAWQGALGQQDVHGVVSVAAADDAALHSGVAAATRAAKAGVEWLGHDDASHLPDKPAGTEHFGFVDGIGQPFVADSGLKPWPGEGTPHGAKDWTPVAAGEFVLGYRGEAGSTAEQAHPLQVDGSYFALRKLAERVAAFRTYVAQMATLNGLDAELVAAKMVGRWRSGAPLVLAPDADDPALAADPARNNDFRYAHDRKGHACPMGAHVRRANPREDPTGPTTQQVRRHRIIRRALPYGPWLPEGAPDDGVDRGVMFGVINADLENQFEYVQRNWMNASISSRALATEADKDPLVGAHDGRGKLLIGARGRPSFCWDLPRFVTVRGGAYFFVPSRSALAQLAGDS